MTRFGTVFTGGTAVGKQRRRSLGRIKAKGKERKEEIFSYYYKI
jgi:hypothetical protein